MSGVGEQPSGMFAQWNPALEPGPELRCGVTGGDRTRAARYWTGDIGRDRSGL